MRHSTRPFTLLLLFWCVPCAHADTPQDSATPGQRQAAPPRPVITFAYADLYDAFCAEATGTRIDPAAVEELQNRLGEFDDAWRREAPMLLSTVVESTGAPFAFGETKAALSLCNPGALSFPLIIDVRRYLKSASGADAQPLDGFVATVFHETLHRYINDRKAALPGGTTPLLAKYAVEPPPVRNHVHLFAFSTRSTGGSAVSAIWRG